jgi:hypothetical protein
MAYPTSLDTFPTLTSSDKMDGSVGGSTVEGDTLVNAISTAVHNLETVLGTTGAFNFLASLGPTTLTVPTGSGNGLTVNFQASSSGQAIEFFDHLGNPIAALGPTGGWKVFGDRIQVTGASVFGPFLALDGTTVPASILWPTSAGYGLGARWWSGPCLPTDVTNGITTGAAKVNDLWYDSASGVIYQCTVAGTPGSWVVYLASNFVERSGTQLTLNGAPYRFTGFNQPYQLNPSPDSLTTALAAWGPSPTVGRIMAYQTRSIVSGALDFTTLDALLATYAAYGKKAIIVLGNGNGDAGGPVDDGDRKALPWFTSGNPGGYDTKIQSTSSPAQVVTYRSWVQQVVTRYANNPTILMWQLVNEGQAATDVATFAGTNGAALSTLGTLTLNATAASLGYGTTGSGTIITSGGSHTFAWTGTSGSTLTGCTYSGSAGDTVATGAAITPVNGSVGNENTANTAMVNFLNDMGALVKGIDPNHLLSLGNLLGFNGGGAGQQWAGSRTFDLPPTSGYNTQGSGDYYLLATNQYVDVVDYHDYGTLVWSGIANATLDLQAAISIANAAGKVLMVGEVAIDWTATPQYGQPVISPNTIAERAVLFQKKLQGEFAAGVGGVCIWSWRNSPITSDGPDYGGEVGVGDPLIPLMAPPQAITNQRISERTLWLGGNTNAAPIIDTDLFDVVHIVGQTSTITSFTTNLTGTPMDGDELQVSITGSSTGITWGASFESSTVTLPTTTSSTNRLDVFFVWNTVTSAWRCILVA